jgi:AcrR family transcriptional regulator
MSDSHRPYHSPLREERARQTRNTVLRSARRLFEKQGFAATTIRDIAQEASVSEPTVYATFGSKAALVIGLLEHLEQDARMQQDETSPDNPERALAAWLDAHVRVFEGGRSLLRVMMQALDEPDVAQLAEKGDRHRRRAIEHMLSHFADANRLSPDLDIAAATDQAWAISSVAVYFDLTDRCRWTTAQYRTWLERAIRQLLLRPEDTTQRPEVSSPPS